LVNSTILYAKCIHLDALDFGFYINFCYLDFV